VLQKSAAFPPTVIRKAVGGQWSKFRRIPTLKAFAYPASMTELQIVRPKGHRWLTVMAPEATQVNTRLTASAVACIC